MAPSLEAYANKSSNKTALIRINVDTNSELSDQFGVKSIPYFVLYDDKGNQTAAGQAAREWVNKNVLMGR